MKFHYLARAIIFVDGKVLLAHKKGAAHTFLPGGHIEFGEQAEAALAREIAEETGLHAVVQGFVGAVEGFFFENDKPHHEINLVFAVSVPGLDSNQAPASLESHLEFLWSKPSGLKERNLLPEPMIECLLNWESGSRGFWGSAFEG